MSQSPTLAIGPTGVVRLPDGRSITFSAAGSEDGLPVVYCHGAIGSPRWRTPTLDRLIERLSIRYLMVNRPGFAGSDPSPGRTAADVARDLGEVMSCLGHRRFSVVGVSAGAPYALACGWALAERLVGLAAVSPLSETGDGFQISCDVGSASLPREAAHPREALEPADALAQLERGAGGQFDPSVVAAFRAEFVGEADGEAEGEPDEPALEDEAAVGA